MLTPEYLERCPDRMVELWAQAERDILANMARKINSYDYFSSASDWQAKKLKEMGLMNEEILSKLSKLTGRTVAELKRLLNEAGMMALQADDAAYRAAGHTPGAIKDNPALVAVMEASLTRTANSMVNLTRTTARQGAQQFVEMLDRVYMQVVTGGMSPDAATRQAIRLLAREGLRAVQYAHRTDHVDVAVRRAVRTGVNQTTGILQETRADEFGADLVETSAHSGARPTHAEWQGKVFSRSGSSKKYPPFKESTGYGTVGGLCGVNCRHSFYPFFEDSQPLYTPKELEELNAKKYRWKGDDLTEYEATQKQRYHERQIRAWKRERAMLKAVGESTELADGKIAFWEARQDDFLKATGLKRHYDAEKTFDLSGKGGTIIKKGIGGAINPAGKEATAHAERYYGLVRSMTNDVETIAKNTGYTVAEIARIKNYIFIDEHDLGDAVPRRFDPDYMMAETWRRLIAGKTEKHDLTLLRHEVYENELVEGGMAHDDAHRMATERHNYAKEAKEYYAEIAKRQKRRKFNISDL